MSTCLYTLAGLTESTKVEHTIPESLGGRVRSRHVTSTEFNEASGNVLVPALKTPYAMIINRLGPLLPNHHQSGLLRVDVEGESRGLALDSEGVLTQTGIEVVSRDANTNRPRTVIASNEKMIRKILRQSGARDDQITITRVPASTARILYHKAPVIWADTEIAALHSTLITFDHLLRGVDNRFTRSDSFAPLRNCIRTAVENRKIDNGVWLNQHSLGLQYEKLESFSELRKQISHPVTPFEHVLFASTNLATRTVDLVWNVLGFDPFGFRVIGWSGPSMTFGFVNPILKGTECSELVEFPQSMLLCKPTVFRAFPDELPDANGQQHIIDTVIEHRHHAFGEAVLLVEMQADEFVTQNLQLSGDLRGGTTEVAELVCHRLCRMFGRTGKDGEFVAATNKVVQRACDACSAEQVRTHYVADQSNPTIDWSAWLTLYRKCLTSLVARYGNPGDAFPANTGTVIDGIHSRKLGEQPQH